MKKNLLVSSRKPVVHRLSLTHIAQWERLRWQWFLCNLEKHLYKHSRLLKQKAKGRFWSAFTSAKRSLGSIFIIATPITK